VAVDSAVASVGSASAEMAAAGGGAVLAAVEDEGG
jgi:hypothetical protein